MSRTRMHVWTSFTGLAMAASLCHGATGDAPRVRRRGTMKVTAVPTAPSGAVALFKFLARPAPARVVAPDLLGRLDPPLLDRRGDLVRRLHRVAVRADAGRAGAARRLGERARLRGPDAARVRDLPGARRAAARRDARPRLVLLRRRAVLALDLHLDVEDHPREVRPDGVHQVGEQLERLVLVGDDRLDLGEPAEVDALAQVVHVVKVLAPAVVDDLQQQEPLQRAHQLVAELRLAAVVQADRVGHQPLDELLAVEVLRRHLVGRQRRRPDVVERDEQAVEVPLLHVVAGRVLLDHAADDRADLVARGLAHVLAFEDVVAVLVDDPPLLVHDVVVLEHALADEEVLLLDLALGLLDLLRQQARLDRLLVALLVGRAEAVQDLVDPVAGEQADEGVLGGEEEARLARGAPAPGAAAELVVDPPRLVGPGADDEQAAGLHDVLAVLLDALLDLRQHVGEPLVVVRVTGPQAELGELELREVLGVAAELDVDAAAGHVRRDRDRAGLTRLGDDLALALGVLGLGVEDRMGDAPLPQLIAEQLRHLDRDRADEDRLAILVPLLDLRDDRVPLAALGLEHLVVAVGADHRAVRWDLHDAELVDLHELGRLGEGGARHARELVVHAEVVLERDRREGLVLLLDPHALLGLDGLVQALRPAAALEDAARELVDDPDLVVDHRVVDVALVERLGLQRLQEVVDHVAVLGPVQVVDAQELLGLRDAALGDRDGLVLLVELVVEVGDEVALRARVEPLGALARLHLARELGELDVELGRLLRRAGDDQRRAGLVDEDVVDLVDHGERVAALDLLLDGRRHVVAQVVEAELGVRPVGDVGAVGLDLLLVGLHVLQHADRDAERVVDRRHPLGVAAGEVVVDRDDVDALPRERVEDDGQRGGERLALAGLHLGDVAAVQHHAADGLHVEVAHAHRALAHLADDRERLGQQVVERLAALAGALAQDVHARAQLVVGLELELRLVVADASDPALVLAKLLGLADVQRAVKKPHGVSVAAVSGRFGGPSRGCSRRLGPGSEGGLRPALDVRRSRRPDALGGRALAPPAALLAVALDLTGELFLAHVDRLAQVAAVVLRPQRDALQHEGRLGDHAVGDRRVLLLPELHFEAGEGPHLVGHPPKTLLHVLPKLVLCRGGVAPCPESYG